MEDLPLTRMIFTALAITALPSVVIALLFGGRGLVRAFLLLCVGAAGWLVWFFALSGKCCPTGMEGLALLFVPVLVALAGGWAAVVYLLIGALSLLPDQRRPKDDR